MVQQIPITIPWLALPPVLELLGSLYADFPGTAGRAGSRSAEVMLCHEQWFSSATREQWRGEPRVGLGGAGGAVQLRGKGWLRAFDLQDIRNMLGMIRVMQCEAG